MLNLLDNSGYKYVNEPNDILTNLIGLLNKPANYTATGNCILFGEIMRFGNIFEFEQYSKSFLFL